VLDSPLDGPVCDPCWATARLSLGHYDGALRHIIHAFKYEGRRSLAAPLAAILRASAADLLLDAACVVPVPLHPWKRLRRGFNQSADLARHLGPPVVHALWRPRLTMTQAGLSAAARQRNVQGAFRVSPWLSRAERARQIEDQIVVVVDDVKTTGATLEACARLLADTGAREVRTVTLARADLHHPLAQADLHHR
jgi:ComF family protein